MRPLLLLALAALAACRVDDAAPEAPLAPLDTLAEWPAPADSLGADSLAAAPACVLVAVDTVGVRVRPTAAAAAAGAVVPGDSARVVGRAPGWLALAGGAGPLPGRWAAADGAFALRGDCTGLRALPLVAADACVAVAPESRAAALFARPDTAASVVAELPPGGVAEVLSRTAAGWVRVRLPEAGAAPGPPGWLAPGAAALDGATCSAR